MVEEHLRKLVLIHHRNWFERLPIFLPAYQASTFETAGRMSSSIVLGERYFCSVICHLGLHPTRSRL
jgi:hypothetical protein